MIQAPVRQDEETKLCIVCGHREHSGGCADDVRCLCVQFPELAERQPRASESANDGDSEEVETLPWDEEDEALLQSSSGNPKLIADLRAERDRYKALAGDACELLRACDRKFAHYSWWQVKETHLLLERAKEVGL